MSSRDRNLLGVIVLLIVAVGGYFIVVAPKRHEASQLQSQIATSQTQLSQAEAEVQAGLTAEAQYKAYVGQLRSLRTAVPADAQIPALINELQDASNRNRVGFESVAVSSASATAAAPAAAGTAASFPSQSFSLSFTGNYFSVAGLLGTLSHFVQADNRHFRASGRLITIGSLTLSPQSSHSGAVTASVTAVDYDVPSALMATSSTSAPGTPTATPAADVISAK